MDRLSSPIVAHSPLGDMVDDYENETIVALTVSAIARGWCPITRRRRNRWILSAITQTRFMGRSIAFELHFNEAISPCAMIDVYPNLSMFPVNTVNHVWIGMKSLWTVLDLMEWIHGRGKADYRLNERGEGVRRWHLDLINDLERDGTLEDGSTNDLGEAMSYTWEAGRRRRGRRAAPSPGVYSHDLVPGF